MEVRQQYSPIRNRGVVATGSGQEKQLKKFGGRGSNRAGAGQSFTEKTSTKRRRDIFRGKAGITNPDGGMRGQRKGHNVTTREVRYF